MEELLASLHRVELASFCFYASSTETKVLLETKGSLFSPRVIDCGE
jgi:hypothetical protein